MKAKVIDLSNKATGEVELNDSIYGLPVRRDILQRMVEWQRAKKRAGTHKTKGYGEVEGSTAKLYRQKGTGHARAGARRSPQRRGGGIVFGPVVRSHAYSLPKKVRKLALKTALSAKQAAGELHILDEAKLKDAKTKSLMQSFGKLGWDSVLIIDGSEVDAAFALAARNLKHVDVLPEQGANVLDILKHDKLVLTKAAVERLEARLA